MREREHLRPDEMALLIKAAGAVGRYGHRDATLLLMIYRHGLRVSEAVALQSYSLSQFHGTTASSAPITLSPAVFSVKGQLFSLDQLVQPFVQMDIRKTRQSICLLQISDCFG